jgi:hypothetical protein
LPDEGDPDVDEGSFKGVMLVLLPVLGAAAV